MRFKFDTWINGYMGEGDNTAEALDARLQGGPKVVGVNSPGGVAFEGPAMCGVLEARAIDTVVIVGIAASSASFAAMGASRIIIHRSAMFMIHDPSAVTIGPADTHRKVAGDLEKMARVYAEGYARATGHSPQRIAKWMRDETWMTAEEAVDLNFADEIWDGDSEAVASFDYGRFQNAPDDLVRLAVSNGWTKSQREQA